MNTIFGNVKSDRQFSATTGFDKEQFYDLVFEYDETKTRFIGDGLLPGSFPQSLPSVEQRVFFTLYFLKVYPTIDVLGICFGMDASSCEAFLQKSLFILEKTLLRLKVLPPRKFSDHKQLQKALAGLEELVVDATERRTEKPENKADQADGYSGKKSQHPKKHGDLYQMCLYRVPWGYSMGRHLSRHGPVSKGFPSKN